MTRAPHLGPQPHAGGAAPTSLPRRRVLAGLLGTAGLCALPARAAAAGPEVPLGQHVSWGAYVPPEPYPDTSAHLALEHRLGVRLPVLSWFQNWSAGVPRAAAVAGQERRPLQIAWQPVLDGGVGVPFSAIVAGAWDSYIGSWFAALSRYPAKVDVRFAHEMNGRSYPWSAGHPSRTCTSPAEYVAAWHRLAMIKDSAGATNVRLLFDVMAQDAGGVAFERFWPGAASVGAVSFTAYCGFGGQYVSPAGILTPTYRRLTGLTSRPLLLSELGCREPSRDDGVPADPSWGKAQWLTGLFAATGFPRVTRVVFFSALRERDWRIDSSAAAARVVARAVGGAA